MIRNFDELIGVAEDKSTRKARELALNLVIEGIKAADPHVAIERHVKVVGELLVFNERYEVDLSRVNDVYVIGMGKAVGAMAESLEAMLDDKITEGIIIVPKGTANRYKLKKIRACEGGHPIPNEGSLKCAERLLSLAESAGEEDLVICLLSGGGSALASLPVDDVSLEDLMRTTELLLRSGAEIREVNTVRKHISRIKGGWLAKAAYPARLFSLIISDVVGDDVSSIASGPTAPDKSTFKDVKQILEKYEIWHEVPSSVRRWIELGVRGDVNETPKPDDVVFEKVHNIIIASNRVSLQSMAELGRSLGLNVLILTSYLEGEAREVGKVISSILREVYEHDIPVKKPAAIIAGGETTVTVKGHGKGGRNQELALSVARMIKGLKGVALLSMGSDGLDGITDAAGAIVDGNTISEASGLGLDPERYLADNDSYTFFKKVGGSLIFTGPTGTNVNDFVVGVVLG